MDVERGSRGVDLQFGDFFYFPADGVDFLVGDFVRLGLFLLHPDQEDLDLLPMPFLLDFDVFKDFEVQLLVFSRDLQKQLWKGN